MQVEDVASISYGQVIQRFYWCPMMIKFTGPPCSVWHRGFSPMVYCKWMGWTSANILGQIFEHVISTLFRLGIPSKVTLCFLVLIHHNHQIRFAEDFLNRTSNKTRKSTDTDTRLFSGFTDSPSPSPKKLMLLCLLKLQIGSGLTFFWSGIFLAIFWWNRCVWMHDTFVFMSSSQRPWGFPGGFDDLNGQKKRASPNVWLDFLTAFCNQETFKLT